VPAAEGWVTIRLASRTRQALVDTAQAFERGAADLSWP
jgi:hypothetical protein